MWQFLRKLGIHPPQDPATPLIDIYLKDAQSFHKDICPIVLIAALSVIVRTWEQLKCLSTEEWIKKMWYIYTIEYYSVLENKNIRKSEANGWDKKR